jgi:hypothetical protein
LEGRRAQGWSSLRGPGGAATLAIAAALALAGCGGGQRQDAREPKGTFKVRVVRASFPSRQTLAQGSHLTITVQNASAKTIPDIAVTLRGLDYRTSQPGVADPSRPRFVINGVPKMVAGFPDAQEDAPPGGETAYVGTWALGALRPGAERTFRWGLTAVKGGPFRITYVVAAGLNGRARAVDENGSTPSGAFTGTVSTTPAKTRVANDGHTIVPEQ